MCKKLLFAGSRLRLRLFVTAMVLAAGIADPVSSQQRPSYEAFSLRNTDPTDVARRVENAFAGRVEVVANPRQGQVLVQGDPDALAAVQNFIRSIDSGPSTVQNSASLTGYSLNAANGSVNEFETASQKSLTTYRVHPRELDSLASLLQSAYGPNSGLSVTTRPQQQQIFVAAPISIQSEIQNFMSQRGYYPEPAQGVARQVGTQTRLQQQQPTQGPVQQQSVQRQIPLQQGIGQQAFGGGQAPWTQEVTVAQYQLQNIGWREFESSLVRTWGNQLQAASNPSGDQLTVQLPTPEGIEAQLLIDRRNQRLELRGPTPIVTAWQRAVTAIDVDHQGRFEESRWISTGNADVNAVRQAVSYLHLASAPEPREGAIRSLIPFTQQEGQEGQGRAIIDPNAPNTDAQDQNRLQDPNVGQEGLNQEGDEGEDGDEQTQGLIGPVQLQFVPELNLIIAIGNPRDIAYVESIIAQLVEDSEGTKPEIELYSLENVDSQAVATIITDVYQTVFAERQNTVSSTPLLKPNALLLIGSRAGIEDMKEFIAELDKPVPPSSEFRVFHLRYMSAIDAKARIDEHYNGIANTQAFGGGGGLLPTDDIRVQLAARVRATADYRSNVLIVSASPRDLVEVGQFIEGMDVNDPKWTNKVEIIYLKNALASELASVLQGVLNGQLIGAGIGSNPTGQQNNQNLQNLGQQQPARIRSVALEMTTVDDQGNEVRLIGGINFDVRVSADANSNALIIEAPEENLPLIKQLIKELDRLPEAETLVKVYQLVHGDAAKLLDLLTSLFGTDQQGQAAITLPLQSGSLGDSSTLVALRFAVDTRTNSIIFSGSPADIQVIEDILIRLDAEEYEDRVTRVMRLSNSSATDVVAAVQIWLDGQADLNSNTDLYSIYQQQERTIIVVDEPASNSIIISATPEFLSQVEEVIETLDRRPPMVMIQVLLAQVTLSDNEEFGIEAGLQDSLLFDRGAASGIGFNFNQSGIGNDVSTDREPLLAQGLSNLNVGRTNSTLGFGGLVLSAGNESVSLLLRALKQKSRLQVLSRPQIMTMENIEGFVQVGQQVPYVTDSQLTNVGVTNTVTLQDVGILLQVTPRVGRDNMMVLDVDATNSSLGPEEEGVAISVSQNGDTVRAPRIDIITASTTVMARSGQTIVMGGLIQKSNSDVMRGVPIISEIPGIGSFFRFDASEETRQELLIIMTPYLVWNEDDITMVNHMEMDRMSWCLADITDVHGQIGYSDFGGNYIQTEQPMTVYPDLDPTGTQSPQQMAPSVITEPMGVGSGVEEPRSSDDQGNFSPYFGDPLGQRYPQSSIPQQPLPAGYREPGVMVPHPNQAIMPVGYQQYDNRQPPVNDPRSVQGQRTAPFVPSHRY